MLKGGNHLKRRIERLEREARIRRRWQSIEAEINRRIQEGRTRVAEWRRQQAESERAA